jgi:hypothetical protein
MPVLKLTEGFGQNVAGIKVFEDMIRKSSERAAATRQGITRMHACYEETDAEELVDVVQCLIPSRHNSGNSGE